MNDNELFELCKSVYEATKWETDESWCAYKGQTPSIWNSTQMSDYQSQIFEIEIPAVYTSDYLLEKLPSELHKNDRRHLLTLTTTSGGEFKANYISPTGYLYMFLEPQADSALKALLKLTLELHKKGLLDAKDN